MVSPGPLSGQEELIFPLPVGRATALYSLHSECATFPLSFQDKGIQHVSFKIAFPSDFMTRLKFLVDLGFGSEAPLSIRQSEVSPREVLTRLTELQPQEVAEPQDCDVLRVVTTGERAGQPIEITHQVLVLPYQRWNISAGALDTGTPLAIAGRLLATGKILRRGAHGPENCIPPELFFPELARYAMHVTETRTVTLY